MRENKLVQEPQKTLPYVETGGVDLKKEFDFSREFGEIDEKLVESAGREWNRKKYNVLKLYSRKIAGVAIFAMLCIAAMSNSRVQAAVKEFTTKIGEVLGFTKDLSSYTEIIDQTQTKNGISLTLKEVILDDRVLMVSVHADFGENEGALWVNDEKTLINGQRHMPNESLETAGPDTDVFKAKRDTVLVQVYEDQILPDGDVDVHLVLEGIKMTDFGDAIALPDDYEEKATEFIYDFVITPAELKAKTTKQKLDVTVGASGEEKKNLTLKELTMNDLYCRIIAEGAAWDDDWPNQYALKLKGTDSFGNSFSLEGGRFVSENEMLFATDFLGDDYEVGEVIEDDGFRISVPDKDCDYLDLQLYERKMIWEGAEEMEEDLDEEEYFEDENYGWEPVGEPFRITITQTNDSLMALCELPESQEEEFEDLYTREMSWQAGPKLANPLNALIPEMAFYDTETTLPMGYNHNNVIGIIGSLNGSDIGNVWKNYYILDIDHVENKEVGTKRIPMKEATKGIVVDAMEPLCRERTAIWAEEQ